MSCNSQRELEEERRLLYVAITRAEKSCHLSCARNRYRYGKMEFDTPSRFIKDIDSSLLETSDMTCATGYSSSGSSFYNRQQSTPFRKQAADTEYLTAPRFSNIATPANRTLTSAVPDTTAATPSVTGLDVGSIVEHTRFGIGTVTKIEGSGENCKATVNFKNLGTKQLLVKFARLKILK